jgi:2-haloacid dehalogenase
VDVRALVFDVFGTVVDWRSGVAREAARLLPEVDDPHAVADDWRGRYQPSMEEVRSGRRPWTILDVLHRESLDALLAERGLDPSEEVRAELVLAWHRLDPWPDVVEDLTRLKERFTIGPMSNGNVALLVDMAKRAGLPWDVILGAEVARHYKPDPGAYDSAPALLGLRPEQVGMVAAHVDDLAAARARGLTTFYVHRPDEFGGLVLPPATDPDATASVASFTELCDVVLL